MPFHRTRPIPRRTVHIWTEDHRGRRTIRAYRITDAQWHQIVRRYLTTRRHFAGQANARRVAHAAMASLAAIYQREADR